MPKEVAMVDVTTYSEARQNFAKLLDRVVNDNEPIIVARKKRGSVVLVPLAEWNSIQETLYLIGTRANARALLDAMDRLDAGQGIEMTMAELREMVRKGDPRRRPRKMGKPARKSTRRRPAKAMREAAE
jgi:antitoxin YefM